MMMVAVGGGLHGYFCKCIRPYLSLYGYFYVMREKSTLHAQSITRMTDDHS